MIPDHRVRLTQEGWNQAEEAGRRLKGMLRPDDTLQFFTSPYRRTRETTEGILKSLCGEDGTPSPFPRQSVKVYEEPRIREQDFGNFQPCSAEMERMWQERADYGHFFYRIPNGESAADAYDRVSGFNESLWRSFGEQDFPSVCVLVTHGLMTRVFLMKWYHWSVEYFEDLRNINHCEFIVMKRNEDNGKYALQNQLRTWSELKRRATAHEGARHSITGSSASTANGKTPTSTTSQTHSPVAVRKWGGCSQGCDHNQMNFPRRTRRQNTLDIQQPPAALPPSNEKSDHPLAAPKPPTEAVPPPPIIDGAAAPTTDTNHDDSKSSEKDTTPANADVDTDSPLSSPTTTTHPSMPRHYHHHHRPSILRLGRDFGGSRSGAVTPADVLSDDSDYFSSEAAGGANKDKDNSSNASNKNGNEKKKLAPTGLVAITRKLRRQKSSGDKGVKGEETWAAESGMGSGARADALGDHTEEEEEEIEEVEEDESEMDSGGEATPGTGRSAVSEVELAEMRDRSVTGSVY
ncbi:MAG: hypothetical protein M1821_005641 [Bathelium mastoideum]|nr:MAG: hypothetical protein M1821_005641 [Bathelium mastoideum]